MIVIRRAVAADVDRIVEMGRSFIAGSAYKESIVANADAMRRTAALLIDAVTAELFLAEKNGRPIGMLGAYVYQHPISDERIASELFWWVDLSDRGRAGLMLFEAFEKWADGQKVDRVQMVAPDERTARLYLRRGYRRIETHFQRSATW